MIAVGTTGKYRASDVKWKCTKINGDKVEIRTEQVPASTYEIDSKDLQGASDFDQIFIQVANTTNEPVKESTKGWDDLSPQEQQEAMAELMQYSLV